jgi:hypothetical protein
MHLLHHTHESMLELERLRNLAHIEVRGLLTKPCDGSSEMTEDRRFGIAHLSLD